MSARLYRFRVLDARGRVTLQRYFFHRAAVDRQVRYWTTRGCAVTIERTLEPVTFHTLEEHSA